MTADPFEICPQCGKSSLKRMLGGGAGMIFKGSGFHLTDYRKAGSGSSPKEPPKSSTQTKPSPPPGTPSDAKPPGSAEKT